ncbi:hypothetical protein SEA_DIZZYRUDY_79 [Microbacterium phage DizzyRudy]|nr:hypothetical protein SEA_DIZZYRUDY_79 [Microbacterium phage DizzyRudy]
MSEHRGFWAWFWALFNLRLHYFVIDERKGGRRYADEFWYYKRRFWHFYRPGRIVRKGDYLVQDEESVWQAHLETPFRKWKYLKDHIFAARFHIGNQGSETPWDGHLVILGFAWYWGHSGFRNLAERLSQCSGYKYDTRNWMIRISDNRLYWEFANHDDMCGYHDQALKVRKKNRRRGSINISIPEAIWGPKRYSYVDKGVHQALLRLREDNYAVILTLQEVYYGRTKVKREKHIRSWSVDVDAPRGIPTHVDHSGGYKGDRTFGFGVKLPVDGAEDAYVLANWEWIGMDAVKAWVLAYRERTGFVKPDEVDA